MLLLPFHQASISSQDPKTKSSHNHIDAFSFCLFVEVLRIALLLLHCFIEQVQLLPRHDLIQVRIQRILHRPLPFSPPLKGQPIVLQIVLLASQPVF